MSRVEFIGFGSTAGSLADQWGCSAANGTEDAALDAGVYRWSDDKPTYFTAPSAATKKHLIVKWLSTVQTRNWVDGRQIDDRRAVAGSVVMLQAGSLPEALNSSGRVLHVHIRPDLVEQIACELQSTPGEIPPYAPLADRALSTLLDLVVQEVLRPGPRSSLADQGLELALAGRVATSMAGGLPGRHVGRLAPWQLKRVTEQLINDLAADVGLADLAAEVRLSPFHFSRAFKASTGLPPHQWLIARRMERARELLENSNLPISEISATVGYSEPSTFAAAFRRFVGTSPSAYRSAQRP